MERKFFVRCEPRGQGRPRFVKATGAAYKSREDVAYEKNIMLAYKNAYPGYSPIQGAFSVNVSVFFKIPDSYTKAQKKNALEGLLRPTKRSDLDNCVKSVLDSLNRIAYADDKNAVQIVANKYYAESPGVMVEIQSLEEEGEK